VLNFLHITPFSEILCHVPHEATLVHTMPLQLATIPACNMLSNQLECLVQDEKVAK
jgi:hypothetical protein